MKFRLKLWVFELEIDTPAPEQISTMDVVTAVFSSFENLTMQRAMMCEDETEE